LQENPLLEKVEGDDEPLPTAVQLASAGPAQTETPVRDEERPRDDDGEARERSETPERADFEDYSGGETDWGGTSTADDDEEGFYPQQGARSTLRAHLLSAL